MSTGQQAPLEPGFQAVLQAQHLLGGTVGGKDDLPSGLVERIEGMEHLLLGALLAGDELYVVHEEDIRRPVFVPELLVLACPNVLDELVGKKSSPRM